MSLKSKIKTDEPCSTIQPCHSVTTTLIETAAWGWGSRSPPWFPPRTTFSCTTLSSKFEFWRFLMHENNLFLCYQNFVLDFCCWFSIPIISQKRDIQKNNYLPHHFHQLDKMLFGIWNQIFIIGVHAIYFKTIGVLVKLIQRFILVI